MASKRVHHKISGFINSDTEDEIHLDGEDSALPLEDNTTSNTATKKRGGTGKASQNKVTKSKAAPRKARTNAQTTGRKGSKKVPEVKRSALELQANAQTMRHASHTEDRVDDTVKDAASAGSEDELDSPKTIADQAKQQKRGVTERKGSDDAQRMDVETTAGDVSKNDRTPTVARQSKLKGTAAKGPSVVKTAAAKRKATANPEARQRYVPETQAEPTEIDQSIFAGDDHGSTESLAQPVARSWVRADSRSRHDTTIRRRAGSASDTERTAPDPAIRRKLGDLTRKFENLDLKYRNLREVGILEANANMEKLRKQCEASTTASNELVASLKKELATQASLAQESKKLQKNVQVKDAEICKLHGTVAELNSDLDTARNEIKALQAKLAASRSASVAVETAGTKTPASAIKNVGQTRTIMVGSAEAAQAAQMAQLKEDLYSDLTGLILRGVKRGDVEDSYDCLQTGRNGTLHFKLNVTNESDGKPMSFEDTEFLYTPLLDQSRDRELLDLLPDYLTEEITFSRQHASKFYGRVVDTLTKRKSEE